MQQSNSGPHLSEGAEYAKSGHVLAITPALIEAVQHEQVQQIALSLNGGAISDVDPTGSAVAHRREKFQMELEVNWTDMGQTEARRTEVHAAWDRLQKFTSGFYANLTVSDQKAIDDNYGPNRDRLAQIKRQFDPDNFFRLNANIRPAS